MIKELKKDYKVSSDYYEIEEYILAEDFIYAQSLLDEKKKKDINWHVMQAVIYHKKGFLMETRKQLKKVKKLAKKDEYNVALDKYNKLINNNIDKAQAKDSQEKDNTINENEAPKRSYPRVKLKDDKFVSDDAWCCMGYCCAEGLCECLCEGLGDCG